MINGAHVVIFSKQADADRAFLRETLQLTGVDAGGGWLIFSLPPAEMAVHPAEESGNHELYLMCEDIHAFVEAMRQRHVTCAPVRELQWGLLTSISLPGGGNLGVYEPTHARPGGTESHSPRRTVRRRVATTRARNTRSRRRAKKR